MNKYLFSEVAQFVTTKISVNTLSLEQYISTENMLPNIGGIEPITSLPTIQKCTSFKENDILFSNIRTYFKKVWMAEFNGGCSPDVLVIRSKDERVLLNKYLFLLIRSDDFINFTAMASNGAKMPRGDKKAMLKYEFNIPSIEEQKRIIKQQFTLTDKIQLNTQTNQTLEQIAQAIYKSWFVDYEPTRAKAAVLAAGGSKAEAETAAMRAISGKNAAELAALAQNNPARYQQLATLAQAFPAALVPTDGFGEIPEGWEVSTIGESVETVGGATPSTKEESFWLNGDIHWTTPKDLSNLTDNILIDTNKKITAQGLKKISSGLLPVNTVLMSSRAPVGYLALTKIPVAINQGYIAIKPFGKLSCYYMIQWCYSNMEEIKGRAIGTTFAEISKTNFRGMKIVVPTKLVLAAYNKIIEPIYNRITSNNYESKQLSNTRDLLLPKLLSNGIL